MFDYRGLLVIASLAITSGLSGLAQGEIVVDDPLVFLPEPPVGFQIMSQKIEAPGGSQAVVIIMGREEPGCAVSITIETEYDRSSRPARVAATKGYINGSVEQLTKAGFKLQKNSLPNLDRSDFKLPLECEFVYSNENGGQMNVYQKIVFTDKGYNMQVAAIDVKDLAALKKWIKHVRVP